jgi:serine/threonine protein kinase
MPDLGPRWLPVEKEPLGEGGQGSAFLVSDAQEPNGQRYVAKVLKGAKLTKQSPRWKRLEEEIEVCKSFNHPNVVRVIDSGHTKGSGYPYFVMPFYSGRSLQESKLQFASPVEIFSLFADICDGLAHVHSKGIVHRDIKPANIFLEASRPVAGDFGLCFRFDAESLTETMEVATARWFGAPELRSGHLENPMPCADIYSLGKLLYWLFTGRVYDRDEQEYNITERKLSEVLAQRGINTATGVIDDRLIHAGAFADEIISQTVRYEPTDRLQNAGELASRVRRLIARFQAGGRALDLRLPQRCLFCGTGGYQPLEVLPPVEQRLASPDPTMSAYSRPDVYKKMRDRARGSFGPGGSGGGDFSVGPLFLICQHCGNVQEFRLDLPPEAIKNWRP